MTSIVAKWQSISKKEKTDDEEKKTKNEGSAAQIDDKKEMPGNNVYRACVLFILISPVNQKKLTDRLCFFYVEQLLRQLR